MCSGCQAATPRHTWRTSQGERSVHDGLCGDSLLLQALFSFTQSNASKPTQNLCTGAKFKPDLVSAHDHLSCLLGARAGHSALTPSVWAPCPATCNASRRQSWCTAGMLLVEKCESASLPAVIKLPCVARMHLLLHEHVFHCCLPTLKE